MEAGYIEPAHRPVWRRSELHSEEIEKQMLNKTERSLGRAGGRNSISRKMAGPRNRPQVVNRRRVRGDSPEATRRAGGRTVVNKVEKPAPVVAPRRVRPPESPELVAAKARWVELTSKLSSRHGKPYYADRTYTEGDVLLHKRHGMGVVESVVHEEAIMVLFRDGAQVIEMAQAPTR